jgi:hypothetical protein
MEAKANLSIAMRGRAGGVVSERFCDWRGGFGESKPPQQAGAHESGGEPPFDSAQDKPHSKWAVPNGAISHGMSIKAFETAGGKVSLLL